MIGLQYLCMIYGIKYKTIADLLKVSPVTVSDWIAERRKIPQFRIHQLSKLAIFKEINKDYFQLTLNKNELIMALHYKMEKEKL